MTRARATGLTLVEVLVALALLGVMSAAIVGTFSLTATLNREAATDVDDARTVRSATERIRLEWTDPELYESMTIGTTDGLTVDQYVREQLGGDCSAEVLQDPIVPDAVRIVRITCREGDAARTYDLEFGRP